MFPQLIKWLANLPASYALGLLWWGEVTVMLCSLSGGHLLSIFLFEKLPPSWQNWLFVLALLTWFLVFYLMFVAFGKNSQLMEALINIHRHGGIQRLERLKIHNKSIQATESPDDDREDKEFIDPFEPPERIRASADAFRLRYFVVLPSALVLYLLGFTSTIYGIFARQLLTWEPGSFVLPALVIACVGCLCFWLLMPLLPGYVDMRKLLGHKTSEGE